MSLISTNPFDVILEKLEELEGKLIQNGQALPAEIIDRDELCRRLSITKPTAIRWERRGKIPFFKIGSAVRYNWTNVLKELEKNK